MRHNDKQNNRTTQSRLPGRLTTFISEWPHNRPQLPPSQVDAAGATLFYCTIRSGLRLTPFSVAETLTTLGCRERPNVVDYLRPICPSHCPNKQESNLTCAGGCNLPRRIHRHPPQLSQSRTGSQRSGDGFSHQNKNSIAQAWRRITECKLEEPFHSLQVSLQ
jgi:hypothetical protein